MKTTRHSVEFYATSPRLVQTYQTAAQHSHALAELTEMYKLFGTATKIRVRKSKSQRVVLSHIDEELVVLKEAWEKSVISEAFHLLFTETSTHPDQVTQWMTARRIHSVDRLHVVKADDLQAPEVWQLLKRVCFALERDGERGSIIDAYVAGEFIFVRGPKHRMLRVPVSSILPLKNQTLQVLRNFQIDPDGSFVYWPDVDVHLGWNQFLQAADPGEWQKAQQQTVGYNKRYGAAIRKLREEARLQQSQIAGITDRQIRRIEQGECRATSAALASLAQAHGVELNRYMEMVAKAMK
jgi:hypothetical protein